MGVITFNNISSDTLGILVETQPNYEIPMKKYNRQHVPGRNGDVLTDTGDYDNVIRTYNVALYREGSTAPTLSRELSKWLSHRGDYCRLEDSYQPDIYMMATYEETITMTHLNDVATRATISFNRRPERFLKTGEVPITFNEPLTGRISNPTNNVAAPIIKVYGDGTGFVTVGAHNIAITNMSGYVYIDSTLEDCYKEFTNMNGYVTITNGFPKLLPNLTVPVQFAGGVTRVDITPNWWVI